MTNFFALLTIYTSIIVCIVFSKKSTAELGDEIYSKYPQLETEIIDSTEIGFKGQNKLEIKQYLDLDSNYIEIRFFRKEREKWISIQTFTFEMNIPLSGSDIVLSDLNNDGFIDFEYESALAGRGSNIIRKLFMFDPNKNRLKYIRNSENYPNLDYSKSLDCLTSFSLFGGNATTFLKIEGDILREFARVEVWDTQRKITETDINGNEIVLLEDTIDPEDIYIRYDNYQLPNEH